MMNHTSSEMKRYNHLIGEIDATYHEASLKLGLSDSAMQIFYAICNNGESCLLGDICRLSGLSKQTIHSAIRKLEDEGVIHLEAVGAKAKNVCLTQAGKQLVQKTALRIIEIENDIFDSWAPDEVQKHLELTERFLTSLKEKTETL